MPSSKEFLPIGELAKVFEISTDEMRDFLIESRLMIEWGMANFRPADWVIDRNGTIAWPDQKRTRTIWRWKVAYIKACWVNAGRSMPKKVRKSSKRPAVESELHQQYLAEYAPAGGGDAAIDPNWRRAILLAVDHLEKFPSFDIDRYLEWLKEQDPGYLYWASRQPAARVNKSRRSSDKLERFVDSLD